MIGVQCQLMICTEHIRVPKGTSLKIFTDGLIVKLMSNSDFSLCYHLRSNWKMLIIGKYLPGSCQGPISFLGSKVLDEVSQMELIFQRW